ncbi:unnamed protein product [Amoebophrya sp. A120]|nr:unnamed protein product [Amoebophrya sp. A120]|eukprot:GSA120T00018087001.1
MTISVSPVRRSHSASCKILQGTAATDAGYVDGACVQIGNPACPAQNEDEICETLKYDSGKGWDRFAVYNADFLDAARSSTIGTASVECAGGKPGRYVVLELPGAAAGEVRILQITQVRVFGKRLATSVEVATAPPPSTSVAHVVTSATTSATIAPARKCLCPNGIPSEGFACAVHGTPDCVACRPGFHLYANRQYCGKNGWNRYDGPAFMYSDRFRHTLSYDARASTVRMHRPLRLPSGDLAYPIPGLVGVRNTRDPAADPTETQIVSPIWDYFLPRTSGSGQFEEVVLTIKWNDQGWGRQKVFLIVRLHTSLHNVIAEDLVGPAPHEYSKDGQRRGPCTTCTTDYDYGGDTYLLTTGGMFYRLYALIPQGAENQFRMQIHGIRMHAKPWATGIPDTAARYMFAKSVVSGPLPATTRQYNQTTPGFVPKEDAIYPSVLDPFVQDQHRGGLNLATDVTTSSRQQQRFRLGDNAEFSYQVDI